jgi:uncharacterized membrane protein
MFNKHTTALYALVISSIVVAYVFAISFVQQQAVAQGNQTGGGGGGNKTSGAPGSNRASGNATSGGGTGAGSGGNSTNAQ